MSSSNKRKLNDSFTDDDDGLGSSGGIRSSRARKKSAKVLEMEEFEEELSSSASRGIRSKKKAGKSLEGEQLETPKKSLKSPPKSRKKSPATTQQPVEDLLAAYKDIKEEVPDQGSALKMMLSMPVKMEDSAFFKDENVPALDNSPEIAQQGKSKGKSTSKKGKKAPKQLQHSPGADVGFSSSDELKQLDLAVKEEDFPDEEPPLKKKTSGKIARLFGKDITQKMVVAEKVKKKKATTKTKKQDKQKQARAMQPALLNFEPDSKVETMDYEAFVQTMEGEDKDIKQEVNVKEEEVSEEQDVEQLLQEVEEEDKEVEEDRDVRGETTLQSKVKSKKKAMNTGVKGKTLKGKSKKKEDKEDKTPKRRTTAYTLWCNNTRKELMVQYPALDFAQISKKLAELWQTVSVAQKNTLRKKARKIQKKRNNGEDVSLKGVPASTHMRSGQTQVIRKVTVQTDQPNYTALPVAYNFKVTGNAPIDVAAHLKLLGESLGTIGARLQEHRGHIAVQGSLSVLLDSLICALGPLMCLTNQVPELNSVPSQIHDKTLDNIAYIMPGIG